MKTPLIAIAALAAGTAMQAPAATFYKYTDPTGRVTYVDREPVVTSGKVEVLTVDPDANTARLPDVLPTEAQTEAERIIRLGQNERLSSIKIAEQQLEAARVELVASRKALEDTQNNSVAEDWFYGPSHRWPRPEYAARLEAHEARIKQAETGLAEAERAYRLTY